MAEERSTTAAERALFPDKEVRLLRGKTVVVRPWGMQTGMLLNPRVIELMAKLRGFSFSDLAQLVVDFQKEVYDIIQRTTGMTDEQLNDLEYEDLFTLAQAVLDVCVLRRDPDGKPMGGAAGKLLTLAGLTIDGFVARVVEALKKTPKPAIDESPKPSSSSLPTVTTSTPSVSTPLSS